MVKRKTNIVAESEVISTAAQVNKDAVMALLIVSLTVNLFILVGWVTLQVTSAYDTQVATFLFTR